MNSADINAEPNGGLNNAELVNKDSFERLRSKNRHKEFRRKIFYLFTFPIFMLTYIPISIVAIFKKVTWKPIEHHGSKSNLRVTEK